MGDTPDELRKQADQRRLEVILAEVELAITLQRLSLAEHALGDLSTSNQTHKTAVESLGRARTLFSQSADSGDAMWQTLDTKIRELEGLLQRA